MKKVIIIRDQFSQNKTEAMVDDVCKYLAEQFDSFPENARIYHNHVSKQTDVTPKTVADIEHLKTLDGTFYVVMHPEWIQIVFWVVTAIMAAYSVYTIATMPKPNTGGVGSSNNELAARANQARVKSRIPDIYGMVRSYPDLIAVTYTYYQNEIEVEECLMAIGRGYYQIHDCRDGETSVNGIDGVSVSIYDPDKSIIGTDTVFRAGEAFTQPPLTVTKSSSINGQSLKSPNDIMISNDSSIYFESDGVIKNTSSIDFTNFFKVGDGIAISGANYGIEDAILSGNAVLTPDLQVIVQSVIDVESYANFEGLLLTGASFEYVVEETTIDPETQESTTIVTERSFRDVSGQYIVSSVTRTLSDGIYTYTIQLSSPRQVNYNWNYVVENQTVTAGITLNKNTDSIDLDGTYSIGAISSRQITLANATTVNAEWLKLPSIDGTTLGIAAEIDLDSVADRWVGWFEIYDNQATDIHFNVYFPQGVYNSTNKGKFTHNFLDITIQYQSISESGTPVGGIRSVTNFIQRAQKDSFGLTYQYTLPAVGNVRFRLAKTRAETRNNPVHECKVKDVYVSHKSNKNTYPDVTVVRTKTIATDGALSMKERKLNCLVTRKLMVDGSGALQATRDAGQALIGMALDEYIGRRSSTEIDIPQIKSEIQKIKTYFGSDAPAEFSYTFDDDSLSFEEQAAMIASACFCETYRYGNKLRLKFEAPQNNSALLFNHRNKVPGSEKRTFNLGIDKDYDGVELEYTSPDDDLRVTYVIPENGSARNPLKISTSGIRNHAVAKTRAWREWNKLQYQTESVEFDALDESNLLVRNDRILVADNTSIKTQDGEVVAVDGLTLTLSQDVEMQDSVTYYIHLQLQDATVDMIQCLSGEYMNQIILTRAPLQPLVIDEDRYIKTIYQIVAAQDTSSSAFLLTEASPSDEMTNRLTCINYDARYYEKDHTYI